MKLNKIAPKFITKANPRIGLITLGSDFRIEKDFNNLIYGKNIDLYVNRIHGYNPLTNETLAKMADDITNVTSDILPDQNIYCVAYGCTSGTVAAGYEIIKNKIIAPIPIPNLIKVFRSNAANFSFKLSTVILFRSIMHSPIYTL